MSLKNVFQNLVGRFRPRMSAVGIVRNVSLDSNDAFIERQVPKPRPAADEVLVRVLASAVNPVDTKMRAGYQDEGVFRVFGLDVVGIVEAVGKDVDAFYAGDRVFYSGTQRQDGADATYQVVKAALIANAPKKLNNIDTAAMPLTSITAHDVLFHGFNLPMIEGIGAGQSVLIINGAGGVGSVLIQMAKYLGLTVIATAGNEESKYWVHDLGADFVLDYHEDLVQQLAAVGYPKVDYIANLQDTTGYWDLMVDVIAPYGKIAAIVDTTLPVDLGDLKSKAVSFTWVFMLARGNENYNLEEQGQILQKVAELLDAGYIRSTATKVYRGLTANNIRLANQDVASHHVMGKVVIDFLADEEEEDSIEIEPAKVEVVSAD
ncbi:zinc-binding alcohol dehydrogenase family protein [Fructobacillus ficulneus]|uniref:Alcohol dehydrogenase n=1 Tax=Fructobacillus ficulneus TaxID=157463 RepID=A0A0K8MIQ0_9LACO|nr:zinc-binding alcohol dehydrogenase family protein [Fructobacillus ficulneus]GAP00442.1 alcohol dehydrogenase [Fructobacillus ficulneus]